MENANPASNKNLAGLEKKDYFGAASTLCTGCGHDSISTHIITACYQNGIHPFDLMKMSGIGCSSKTPAYFVSKSFGFNSMHGRMAPVSTGAKIVNHKMTLLGVSGDGDSASIGMGGFAHLIRRNLPMVYLVANNGVYGLTKGQFSATADKGSEQKTGAYNPFGSIDICGLALELGASFVARSFSGDAKQLVPLIQAALKHNGTAVIDIISPCITFNNHDGSTKSYSYIKEHDQVLQELGFYQPTEDIKVDYAEGSTEIVELPDGSHLKLKKLLQNAHDVKSRKQAASLIFDSKEKGEVLTGLFYIDEKSSTIMDSLALPDVSLNSLQENDLRPSPDSFHKIMREFA